MDTLTIAEAMALASAQGIRATVTVSHRERRVVFSVAVTSSDPDPTVSIRRAPSGRRASDMHLGERDQFGPESWDYPAAISVHEPNYSLELSGPGGSIHVPLLAPETLIVASGRWPSGEYLEAAVAAATLIQAIDELTAGAAARL